MGKGGEKGHGTAQRSRWHVRIVSLLCSFVPSPLSFSLFFAFLVCCYGENIRFLLLFFSIWKSYNVVDENHAIKSWCLLHP